MQRLENKVNTQRGIMDAQGLFIMGLVILYLKLFFQQSTLVVVDGALDSALLLFGSMLLLLHCAQHIKEYGKNAVFILLVIILTGFIYIRTGETAPFVATLIAVAAATAGDRKRLIRIWLSITIALVTLLCAAYIIVLVLDPDSLVFIYRRDDGVVTATRYSFFFAHPNMAAAICMMAACAYLYRKIGRIGAFDIILILLFAAIVYSATGSRTSVALMVAAPLLFYLQQRRSILDGKRTRNAIALFAPLSFLGVFLVAGPLYSDGIGVFFTGRVWLWHVCYESQGLTLFGQRFVSTTALTTNGWYGTANTLDSFYANGLFVYGIAFGLLFCWIVSKACSMDKDAMHDEIPFLLIILIFGITEGHILNLVVCPVALLLGSCILLKTGKVERRG